MEEDHALEEALEQAERLKSEGNVAFKENRHLDAIRLYSQAIELDPENAVYYSNRSAAYLAQGDSRGKALKDAERCIELKPDWAKGYSRKAAAEHALKRFDEAKSTYFKALDLDPENQVILSAIEDVRRAGDVHSKELRERHQKEEEVKKERLEKEKAAKATEDDLLASFMSQVQELEDKSNCIQKEEVDESKIKVDFGTSAEQLNRILQPHFEWVNLNPFTVLQLDLDATDEEIKQHYRKLSTLVHPDKSTDPRARDAFEEVKKAHLLLLDLEKRKTMIRSIENACKKAEKERRLKLKKGMKEKDLPSLEEMKKKEVMKAFADIEKRRRNLKTREEKQRKRESEQQDKEQKDMDQDFKKEREWATEERRENRMDHWQDFRKTGKKIKTAVAPGWKGEERKEEKHGKAPVNQYKKTWK